MENIIKKITDEVSGIAIWSDEWDTYTNCYIVKEDRAIFLIDTVRKEHSEDLIKLLSSENIDRLNINTVIATHGHRDHIGNIGLFENAGKFIHNCDKGIVEENERKLYKILDGEKGRLLNFEWIKLGIHTPGSIVLYHKATKTLFVGDYIFFSGFPLPQDGLVSEAPEMRDFWFEFISSGEFSKYLKQQNVDPLDIARDFERLGTYDADYLCTGHGVVLKHNIPSFFNKLSKDIINYEMISRGKAK